MIEKERERIKQRKERSSQVGNLTSLRLSALSCQKGLRGAGGLTFVPGEFMGLQPTKPHISSPPFGGFVFMLGETWGSRDPYSCIKKALYVSLPLNLAICKNPQQLLPVIEHNCT